MALDVSITLNDAQQAELEKLTTDHNRGFPGANLTPRQKARNILQEHLDVSAQQRVDTEKLGFRQVYNVATPEDKAVMDAMRAKYNL